ncbi:TetR family transcriptional regulator [Christiangramia fulva]|uniref:TetR family transcriptional regulator n=1 Tax=Christiangramia fulva TaxID=2126553 RepID=A0A2R3Z161_9FLAO|nr:TetR/AcrR family transcriptional regulator [Christiangramia fulva]AVR44000.1 TetR family transcriptional regulator [Christiangramia fulva]
MELNEKQIQILEVAEKLFAENGFDGTSVRQIAGHADINVAMISYYFGSKEKLLAALLLYRTSDFRIQIESVLSEEMGYLEKVDAIVELIIRRIHRNRRVYKIIHFEYSNLSRKLDFANYIERKKENFSLIERFVKEGQEKGVFSKNINIQLIGPTILGTYFNFYYNKRFFQAMHGLDPETSFEEYIFNVITPHIQNTIKALLTYEI